MEPKKGIYVNRGGMYGPKLDHMGSECGLYVHTGSMWSERGL